MDFFCFIFFFGFHSHSWSYCFFFSILYYFSTSWNLLLILHAHLMFCLLILLDQHTHTHIKMATKQTKQKWFSNLFICSIFFFSATMKIHFMQTTIRKKKTNTQKKYHGITWEVLLYLDEYTKTDFYMVFQVFTLPILCCFKFYAMDSICCFFPFDICK